MCAALARCGVIIHVWTSAGLGAFGPTLPMLKIPWPPMTTGRAVLAVVFVRRVYALSDEHLIPLPTDGEENNQILVQTSDTVSTLPLLADRCVLH